MYLSIKYENSTKLFNRIAIFDSHQNDWLPYVHITILDRYLISYHRKNKGLDYLKLRILFMDVHIFFMLLGELAKEPIGWFFSWRYVGISGNSKRLYTIWYLGCWKNDSWYVGWNFLCSLLALFLKTLCRGNFIN